MIRTQILLPVDLKKALKKRADKKDLSMSELIRKYLYEKITDDGVDQENNILLKMAEKAGKGDNTTTSENFREYYDNLSK